MNPGVPPPTKGGGQEPASAAGGTGKPPAVVRASDNLCRTRTEVNRNRQRHKDWEVKDWEITVSGFQARPRTPRGEQHLLRCN